jgi:Tfp pilus assembly protein PilN
MTAASTPRVNLMPPEIAEAARFRQVQALLGAAMLLVVVVVGVLYWNAHRGVSTARGELSQAQAQQTSLQAKLAQLASVQQTLDEVQSKQSLLATAMGTEVRWSFMLNNLAFRVPSNVWLTKLQVAETATSNTSPTPTGATTLGAATLGATPSASTAPFSIGTVSFEGVALTHDDVARWLDAMARVTGFLDPTFSSSAETLIGGKTVTDFQGAVSLTSSLFSNRYLTTPTDIGTGR